MHNQTTSTIYTTGPMARLYTENAADKVEHVDIEIFPYPSSPVSGPSFSGPKITRLQSQVCSYCADGMSCRKMEETCQHPRMGFEVQGHASMVA